MITLSQGDSRGEVDCLRVIISGRVQGVGFRFSTEAKARALGLNGWVRNHTDRTVEAEFEGSKEALNEMLLWCHSGPAFARVTEVEARWGSRPPKYTGFRIQGW